MSNITKYSSVYYNVNNKEYKIKNLLDLEFGFSAPFLDKEWSNNRRSYEAGLNEKSLEELGELHKKALEQQEAKRFYNQLSANADYKKCARKSYLELVGEATAYVLGKDPKIVNTKSLKNISNDSKFKKCWDETYELVLSAYRSEKITVYQDMTKSVVICTLKLVLWAEKIDLDLDKEFVNLVKKYHPKPESTDWEAECKKLIKNEKYLKYDNKDVKNKNNGLNKSLNKAQEVIAAISKDKFETAGKISIANIISSVARGGGSVSKDSLDKYLTAGTVFLKDKSSDIVE